jgi:hypothetical protein
MRDEQRLRTWETRQAARDRPDYAMIDGLQRAVRDKLTRRVEGTDDTPAQVAQHAALLEQWRVVPGLTGRATGARITARLAQMAARQRAST